MTSPPRLSTSSHQGTVCIHPENAKHSLNSKIIKKTALNHSINYHQRMNNSQCINIIAQVHAKKHIYTKKTFIPYINPL